MSTATFERVETVETPPNKPYVYHKLSDVNIIKKVRGRPYTTLCGIKKSPNPNTQGMRSNDSLTPMEKCVMCQTILSSQ